jgi:PAS domain S-box-containing protein
MPEARRRDPARVDPHVGRRVGAFARGAELAPVAELLSKGRDEILRRWFEAARAQPFHADRPDLAVADHIPHLFDALVAFLQRAGPHAVDPSPPLDDAAVRDAAGAHARDRFAQGLGAADVLTEFRLLRQEIGRALRTQSAGLAADVAGAELLVHDALDGATTLALAALDAQEAARREAEARLRLYGRMLDQAHDAVLAWDLDGGVLFWNRGAEELYGFVPGEALGRSSHELLGTPDAQAAAIRAALERDGWWEGTLAHATREGRSVLVDSRMVLVAEGERRRVLESNRDVTEREALLAALAHDLKTPLTAIKGSADLLARQAAGGRLDAGRVGDRAAAIGAAAKAMAALIGELLDAARLRSGQPLELVRHPTDLVALARRVVGQVQAGTAAHALAVEATVPELVGDWDAFRLERVLGNLLANAVKYSPAGGEVRVVISRIDGPDGGRALLRVRDRGIGIPAADLPRVFERYRRAANVRGRIAGEGIGLAGARQIVEQHGGTIEAESREGEGATFTVRLPLDEAAA